MATRIRLKSQQRKEENKKARPYAKAKYIRMSPSKVAIVLDKIRGQKAEMAVAILENMAESAAVECLKVLKSAIANAENNKGMNASNLFVAECYAGAGPVLKRIAYRAKGRADRILKRTSHITIVLDEVVGG